jgi:hypothetical protein
MSLNKDSSVRKILAEMIDHDINGLRRQGSIEPVCPTKNKMQAAQYIVEIKPRETEL